MKKMKVTITQSSIFTCSIDVPDHITEDGIHGFIETHGLSWESVDKHSDPESDIQIEPIKTEEYNHRLLHRSLHDFLTWYVCADAPSQNAFLGKTVQSEEEVPEGTCTHCNEPDQTGNYCSNCGEEMH